MNGRIGYFCKLCDHYTGEGCKVYERSDEQELHVNKGFCGRAEVFGRPIEMKQNYLVINGEVFRKGGKNLASVLNAMKLASQV